MKHRSTNYRPWLARYSFSALVVTLFLLYAGGFTTTIGAGMVFPDWPLSNGSLNPEGWTENTAMAAEHGHRLLGMIVGNLTLALAIWIWCVDGRRWMRRMGFIVLFLVIVQGILGGVRVLENEVNYAIVHGCLAQIFFCFLTAIAIGQTGVWHKMREEKTTINSDARTVGVFLIAILFVQLMVAAVMRHKGAGLAIPTFPLTPDGSLIPETWNFGVAIHFAHRALALVITVAYGYWITKVFRATNHSFVRGIGIFSCFLLVLQVILGASVIWMGRTPFITTLHVLNSAFLLATTWGTHFFCYHSRLECTLNKASSSVNQTHAPTSAQAVRT